MWEGPLTRIAVFRGLHWMSPCPGNAKLQNPKPDIPPYSPYIPLSPTYPISPLYNPKPYIAPVELLYRCIYIYSIYTML